MRLGAQLESLYSRRSKRYIATYSSHKIIKLSQVKVRQSQFRETVCIHCYLIALLGDIYIWSYSYRAAFVPADTRKTNNSLLNGKLETPQSQKKSRI